MKSNYYLSQISNCFQMTKYLWEIDSGHIQTIHKKLTSQKDAILEKCFIISSIIPLSY